MLCIALWPLMSTSMPILAFFERYVGALPTNTGAPGTVENTVSDKVVLPPVAPR